MTRLILSVFGACLLVLAGTSQLWAKAHVPFGLVQVCSNKGVVKNIRGRRLSRKLDRGACRLPTCDFDNVFQAGMVCDNTDAAENAGAGDGFCDTPGSPPTIPAMSAVDLTVACTDPY